MTALGELVAYARSIAAQKQFARDEPVQFDCALTCAGWGGRVLVRLTPYVHGRDDTAAFIIVRAAGHESAEDLAEAILWDLRLFYAAFSRRAA